MQPHTSYLVCATQRSGSTLLCEALFNTGIAGHAQEYFDALKKTGFPRQPLEYFEGIDTTEISAIFGDTSRPGEQPAQPAPGESYAQYLDKVFKWGMTPNGVFGAKVMWGYFHDFISKLRDIPQYSDLAVSDLLATVFPNLHYIWVTRRDKVGQAVSLWKAIQTWTWKQEQASLTASGRPVKHLTFHFGAIMTHANLTHANLSGAVVIYPPIPASMRGADLTDAILVDAFLNGTDLSNANLSNANLSRVDLSGARVRKKQLAGARTLERATVSNRAKRP